MKKPKPSLPALTVSQVLNSLPSDQAHSMICDLIEEQNTINDAIEAQFHASKSGVIKYTAWHLKQTLLQQALMDVLQGGSIRTDSVLTTLSIHYHSKPQEHG